MAKPKTALDLYAEDERRSAAVALLQKRQEKRSATLKEPNETLLQLFGGRSSSGAIVSASTADSLPIVYMCVRKLARDLAKLPLKLYRKTADGREEATDHPAYSLVKSRPNAWQTSYEWREMMQGHMCLRGNAYNRILRNAYFQPIALIPIHPDKVSVSQLTSGDIVYDVGSERLTQNDVLHFRGLSADGVVGLTPISVLRESIGLGITMRAHASYAFANGNRYPGLLKAPSGSDPEKLKAIKRAWAEQTAGAQNAGTNPVLGGGLDWVSIGMTNQDAQFLESQKLSREEIAACFGIPPSVLGIGEKASTYASAEQYALTYVQDTLDPLTQNYCQRLESLLTEEERGEYYFAFNFKAMMKADAKTRAEYYKTMREIRAMTINEIRQAEEMNDLPDNIGDNPREDFNGQGGGKDVQQPQQKEAE